jgi:hypothetical protein
MLHMKDTNQDIVFHVGLEKTATTYLQRSVFPKFEGVIFVPKRAYWNAGDIIEAHPGQTIFLSHEFGRRNFAGEMKKFAARYPDTRTIMVLRNHAGWIASYYRFLVKRGLNATFNEFFDLEKNSGLWKREDLYYFQDIKLLEGLFNHKPLVMFHDDLKKNPDSFIQRIKDYCGAKTSGDISLTPRHKAYSDKELRIRLWVTRHTFLKEFYDVGHIKRYWGRRLYNRMVRYPVLYFARLVPRALMNKKELIPAAALEKIKEYYREDWEKCKAYADKNNPL